VRFEPRFKSTSVPLLVLAFQMREALMKGRIAKFRSGLRSRAFISFESLHS